MLTVRSDAVVVDRTDMVHKCDRVIFAYYTGKPLPQILQVLDRRTICVVVHERMPQNNGNHRSPCFKGFPRKLRWQCESYVLSVYKHPDFAHDIFERCILDTMSQCLGYSYAPAAGTTRGSWKPHNQ